MPIQIELARQFTGYQSNISIKGAPAALIHQDYYYLAGCCLSCSFLEESTLPYQPNPNKIRGCKY